MDIVINLGVKGLAEVEVGDSEDQVGLVRGRNFVDFIGVVGMASVLIVTLGDEESYSSSDSNGEHDAEGGSKEGAAPLFLILSIGLD